MHKTILVIAALAFAALLLVLLPGRLTDRNTSPSRQKTAAKQSASALPPDGTAEALAIATDIQKYSPLMSSTVGIGLTPAGHQQIAGKPQKFRWQTDHGCFLHWSPPDYTVKNLGRETTNTGGKIYWSYDPEEKPVPTQATVSLTVSGDNGKEAKASLKISTDKNGFAVPKK